MSNLPQSDWILAGRYVDGDLSAPESAKVKSRIDSDEDFAAAVEEIRTQSSLFGSLPNFAPAEDLEDRTLQASLDQVKAIMGAWPIENSDAKVSIANRESIDSFDWKSTAALVASLAGVLMIGAMLWQDRFGGSSDNVAMERAPTAVASSVQGKGAGMDSMVPLESLEKTDSQLVDLPDQAEVLESLPSAPAKEKSSLVSKGGNQAFPARNMPEIGPILGTPASKKSQPTQTARSRPEAPITEFSTNAISPVEQVWCVSQDSNTSRDSVCQILNSNRIQVQREEQPKASFMNSEPFEAFYIAATPKQMKLAMSQISSNADIEMIQLPKAPNSPIADVIAQQFTNSPAENETPVQQQQTANIPPRFKEPASQALAQQLVSNAFPRNFVPSGPLPPILKSGTPIAGLDVDDADAAPTEAVKEAAATKTPIDQQIAARSAAPSTISKGGVGGGGGAGFGGGGAGFGGGRQQQASANESVAAMQQNILSLPQQAELDKYLDDKDQRLRQYLILVRGGEAEKK